MSNLYSVDNAIKSDNPSLIRLTLRKYYNQMLLTDLLNPDNKPIVSRESLINVTENSIPYIISVSPMLAYEHSDGIRYDRGQHIITRHGLWKLYDLGKFDMLKEELYKIGSQLSMYIRKSPMNNYYLGDEVTKWIHSNCEELQLFFPSYYPTTTSEFQALENINYNFRLSINYLLHHDVTSDIIKLLMSWRDGGGSKYVPSRSELRELRKRKSIWRRYKLSLQ